MKEFITIWNSHVLPTNDYEFEKYEDIINKLRKESKLEFIELIEIMGDTIYKINNCADKYGTTCYEKTKIYEEQELNCCSQLINYLEEEIIRHPGNEYYTAVTKKFLESK